MNPEDLIPAGERAKRHLRVAQALTMLSRSRAPALSSVLFALERVRGPQPAVAMAIILEYSRRQPLHERAAWLEEASGLLGQHRLGEDADQKEVELAEQHIQGEKAAVKAEVERIDRNRERLSLLLLALLVSLGIATLALFTYNFVQKLRKEDEAQGAPAAVKTADKALEKKPAEKQKPELGAPAAPRTAETAGKAAKPAGK